MHKIKTTEVHKITMSGKGRPNRDSRLINKCVIPEKAGGEVERPLLADTVEKLVNLDAEFFR